MESQKKYKPEFSIEFFPPKTEEGKIIRVGNKVEEAAKYLAKKNWGRDETEAEQPHATQPTNNITRTHTRNITEGLGIYEGEINIEEGEWIIKKLKRHKAPGPDKIPTETFKEPDPENK